jgi:hypothetical protein
MTKKWNSKAGCAGGKQEAQGIFLLEVDHDK